MYLRLLSIKLRPGAGPDLHRFYESRVLPELRTMPGCLCAALTESTQRADEQVSLTLWDSVAHAEAYQHSDTFERLLRDTKPYLAEASEWKIELSEDLKLEYKPIEEEPVATSYGLHSAMAEEQPPDIHVDRNLLRIVRLKVQPGQLDLVRRTHLEEVLPVLRSVQGCRYACLMGNVEAESELVSITIWDRKEDAARYEQSGLFERLLGRIKHAFPEVFQWKMVLEHKYGGQAFTSADVKVESYTMVTGEKFPQTLNSRRE